MARGNSVALEVPVTATGARGSSEGEQRDLFVEETNTVLVFRDGAVIRLKADVAIAQLVFLTNKKTKREVVCAVRGKRSVPSGHYYVELDFTEAMANFWEVDFGPEVAPRPRPVMAVKKTVPAAKVSQAAPAAGTTGTPAQPAVVVARAPQTVEENPFEDIETFLEIRTAEPPRVAKEEIAEAEAAGAAVVQKSATPDWARAVTQAVLQQAEKKEPEAASAPESSVAMQEPAHVEEARAEVSEAPPVSEEVGNESVLPTPDLDFSGKAVSKGKKSAAKGSAAAAAKGEGSNSRVALLGGLVLAVLLVGAWYENWLPFLRRTSAVALPAGGGVTLRPRAAAKSASAGSADVSPANETDAKDAANDAGDAATTETAGQAKRSERGSRISAKDNDAVNEQPASGTEPAASPDSNGADAVIVPAKLVKSVQAVYPPDAMRNYITGDVIVDAVVKPDGHVGEMNVVTGPAALRQAAMDALKQYEYAAATQGGKAVVSHVKVTVKFWFNP